MATDRFIPGTLEIVLHMSQESSQRAYVLHYAMSAVIIPTPSQLNELATNFFAAISSSWGNLHSATVSADSVTARDISEAGRSIGSYTVPAPHFGNITGDATPANAACCITWATGIAARYGRGRTYLCGIAESQQTLSRVNSPYLVNAAIFANVVAAFTNTGGAIACQLAVASFVHEQTILVNAFRVNDVIDSQRRRLIGRGS